MQSSQHLIFLYPNRLIMRHNENIHCVKGKSIISFLGWTIVSVDINIQCQQKKIRFIIEKVGNSNKLYRT